MQADIDLNMLQSATCKIKPTCGLWLSADLNAAEVDELEAAALVLLGHGAHRRREGAALLAALDEPRLADVAARIDQLRVRKWPT